MEAVNTAKEIFVDVWKLYAKYAAGPQGDPNVYWHNLVADSGKVTEKWPCGLAYDLVKAVLEEHSRREQRKLRDLQKEKR